MRYIDARRLTGPNHLARHPLVLVELGLEPGEDVRAVYLAELARMRVAVGFPGAVTGLIERPHRGGTVIAYAEPIDVMLACAEMSEWAVLSAIELSEGRKALALEPKRKEIETMLARDQRLIALQTEATTRGLPFLWDDESVSVGLGARSVTWSRANLPEVAAVSWERLGRIPVVLVTGTNGKTTSSRWLGRVAQEAGRRVGVTSSDSITVGTEIVSSGDWTGPAAARIVLRRRDVDFAVLETARGGILRRGLAVDACDVALLTNISEDHLECYGIDDLEAMTKVKAVTADAARVVVLNAADPRLAALTFDRMVLFADLESAPEAAELLEAHRGDVVFAKDGRITRRHGEVEINLCRIDEMPLAFGGAARFNVANALGVVAAAVAIGLPTDAIRRALIGFTPADNPRRGALVEKSGARILLDFAHNPDGLRAVMSLVRELRGPGRLFVCLAGAGDRTDHELDEMARVLVDEHPDRVILRELHGYLRGRAPDEVPEVFRRSFAAHGFPADAITTAASEVESLRDALTDARPGDFVVLFVHLDHEPVSAFLAR